MTLWVIAPSIRRAASVDKVSLESGSETYLEKLVKLVPVKAISAYPLVTASAGSLENIIASWALLIAVVVIRAFAARAVGRPTQWAAVAIAAVSFVIWVHVMKGDFGLIALLARSGIAPSIIAQKAAFYSNLALVIWTIVVPYIYKGDEQ